MEARLPKGYKATPLSETVGIIAGALAMVVVGVAGLSAIKDEHEEMDTTAKLLSGNNGSRLLAAIERDKNRQLIARDLVGHELV
ncbi:hypothetical protein GCM10027594_28650 [Hymenobacter agri]